MFSLVSTSKQSPPPPSLNDCLTLPPQKPRHPTAHFNNKRSLPASEDYSPANNDFKWIGCCGIRRSPRPRRIPNDARTTSTRRGGSTEEPDIRLAVHALVGRSAYQVAKFPVIALFLSSSPFLSSPLSVFLPFFLVLVHQYYRFLSSITLWWGVSSQCRLWRNAVRWTVLRY